MQTSLFIAKLLGPSFLIVGTALLTKPEAFRVLLQEHRRLASEGFPVRTTQMSASLLTNPAWRRSSFRSTC